MSVLKLPLLVDPQQKVGELILSITSCPTIIILENSLNYIVQKCGYGNFNHRYNFSCSFPRTSGSGCGCGEFSEGDPRLPKV
jgi:hypothetical protein